MAGTFKECRPCPWVFRGGCVNGDVCKHCHLCSVGDFREHMKLRARLRKAFRRKARANASI